MALPTSSIKEKPSDQNSFWWTDWKGRVFSWDLWYACNYRCSYCWWEMDNLWAALSKQHRVLPPEEWARIWRRIHDLYGEARLDLLGGEPLFYPRAEELLERLCAMHRMIVTTNLSLPIERLRALTAKIPPHRLHFNVSFHPQFAELEPFLEKVLLLKELDAGVGVLFVPWPPLLPRMEEIRERFTRHKIWFTPMIFQGRHDGKTYPEAYTAEESALIESTMLNPDPAEREAEVRYRLMRQSTLGKPCHAGRVYANIKGNGDVFRCGQDAFSQAPMGNIFNPNFRLHEKPNPCPYEKCSCNEFLYLDELRSNDR